jgi:hypothetical protein
MNDIVVISDIHLGSSVCQSTKLFLLISIWRVTNGRINSFCFARLYGLH